MTVCDGCQARITHQLDAAHLQRHPHQWDFCILCTKKILALFAIDSEVKSFAERFPDQVEEEPPANNALTPEELKRLGLAQ